jgi:hypothetical protein
MRAAACKIVLVLRVIPVALLLFACNAPPPPTGDDAGPPDMSFVPAPHPPFPQLTLHSQSVWASPELVTITYQGFQWADQVEAFGDFLPSSQWLQTVGSEYGVTGATHLQKVRVPNPAPGSTTDGAIVGFLLNQVKVGTLPKPGPAHPNLVYLVYFPSTTTIDDGSGTKMCVGGYSGYHATNYLSGGLNEFGYAVLADCTSNLDDLTSTASHEVIEAATDPDDGWYLDPDPTDAWYGLVYAEAADLCEYEYNVSEGGFALQRSWSNAVALAGGWPCVPAPPNEVIQDVSSSPPTAVYLPAGQSTTFTLTGWSSVPTTVDWQLTSGLTDFTNFDPLATFSTNTINNGTTTQLTLTVPSSARQGNFGSVTVFSGDTGRFWPFTVVAQ